MSRRFEEADRLAAGLGLDELRWHLSLAGVDATRRRVWVFAGSFVAMLISFMSIGRSLSTPRGFVVGGIAVGLAVQVFINVWGIPTKPGKVAPAPDTTVDALVTSLEDAVRPLKRRSVGVVHALACAARAWAEEHEDLRQLYGRGTPPGTDRDNAVARLDRLMHDVADELLDGPDPDTARRRLARLDHALRLVSGRIPKTEDSRGVCVATRAPVTDPEAVLRDVAEAFPHPYVRDYLEVPS